MGLVAALWAVIGFTALITSALYRLSLKAREAFSSHEFSPMMWVVLIVFAIFMLHSEGYRGFQQNFSPRAAARALYLARHARWLDLLFAPFFIMCYYHSTRKRKIVSWCLTLGIIGLILLFSTLPQPWRGILDIGVVLGLLYGLCSFFIFVVKAFCSKSFDRDPALPE